MRIDPWQWLVAHDRGLLALRRAGRAAIIMPGLFAIGDKVVANANVATFAAFGSFALLLLADFGGPIRDRLRAQLALGLTGAVFICVGTLASRNAFLAAAAMAVAAFLVLFAGVVSSVLAGASTSLLLAFILPVSLQGPASSIPDRLAGWGMAVGASLIAISLLWPAPANDPLRASEATALRALAARLRADVAAAIGATTAAVTDGAAVTGGAAAAPGWVPSPAERQRLADEAHAAVTRLRTGFLATPYRPTGLSTSARMIVRLVDELTWLDAVLVQSKPMVGGMASTGAHRVKEASAAVLDQCADLLETPTLPPDGLRVAVDALRAALTELERHATVDLPVRRVHAGPTTARADGTAAEFLSSLDPSFRAQEMSFAVSLVAANVDAAAAALRRPWADRLLGRQPDGGPGAIAAAKERGAAHLERHSVWLHNSVRGAIGLGLAVLVANESGVQHSFWVVLGTLSVLRSNALNTGQNAARGVLGTVLGFIVGWGLLEAIGTDTTVLWFLLPVAILVAGVAPAAVSFLAGQAAFTVTLTILYNIIQPAGWRVGLVRVEDILIGCAVSFAVGVLFWPRGARAAQRAALSEAYQDSARYLTRAVEFGMLRCDASAPQPVPPTAEATRAAASSRRLDDAFRTYLAERGAKPVGLADVSGLISGAAALRLAGDAVLELWQRDDGRPGGDRAAAREELLRRCDDVVDWYDDLAGVIAAGGTLRDPLPRDLAADGRLVDAVRHDLRSEDGTATATAVRMIWTGDHLDAARRLQDTLVGPAREAASAQPEHPLLLVRRPQPRPAAAG